MERVIASCWAWVERHWRAILAVFALTLAALAIYAWIDFRDYQARIAKGDTLEAERHLAGYTYGLLLFTFFGTAISIVGIAAVAMTLHATRKMTEATREIGENASKAYVRAVSARFTWEDSTVTAIRVVYQNEGDTPAVQVRDKIALKLATVSDVRSAEGFEQPSPRGFFVRHSVSAKTKSEECKTILPELNHVLRRLPAMKAAATSPLHHPILVFRGVVLYRDVFGRQYRSEFLFYGNAPPTQLGGTDLMMAVDVFPVFHPDPRELPPIIDDRPGAPRIEVEDTPD
ncbi:MAG: hypothetical protein Q8R02_20370 [Hyphomonadaceae bacterium]|nr:hypothetical protein [Hyphomonadaceae bacterium]